jgi:hypothetical protein
MDEFAAKKMSYARSLLSWGGATVDTKTWELVPDGIDAYAVSLRLPLHVSIHVREGASWEEFSDAWDKAVCEYDSPFIGVFHDDTERVIQFDPVAVVGSEDEVDKIYLDGYPVAGGAYHFTTGATGNGYYPGNKFYEGP